MAQFTIYKSTDASAPALSGTVGTLLAVLDACLVNGYGAKAAAGWSKPIANSGNIGCYQQGAAAVGDFVVVINDNGPGAGAAKEARATGWKTVSAITGIGVGTGQFPLPAQLLTVGCVAILKSTTADATSRNWMVVADARTFYLFIGHAGTTAKSDFGFGEFYSLWGTSDVNNCFISGRLVENSAVQSVANGGLDKMVTPAVTSNYLGCFLADSFAGFSGSIVCYPCGDPSRLSTLMTASAGQPATGSGPTPNTSDASYLMAPLNLTEGSWALRGRYRGLYQICHPLAALTDGATLDATGDLNGKSFVFSIPGGTNLGCLAIETSDTLDTN